MLSGSAGLIKLANVVLQKKQLKTFLFQKTSHMHISSSESVFTDGLEIFCYIGHVNAFPCDYYDTVHDTCSMRRLGSEALSVFGVGGRGHILRGIVALRGHRRSKTTENDATAI